jgi:hypothetical protein
MQQQQSQPQEKYIYRSLSIPLCTFEYMKEFQRDHMALTGEHLSNSKVLAMILSQHKDVFALPVLTDAACPGSEAHG